METTLRPMDQMTMIPEHPSPMLSYATVLDMPSEVLVFKTSVRDAKDVAMLGPWLDHMISDGRWNFDLEDSDRILRVQTNALVRTRLLALLNGLGFACEELE